MSYVIGQLTVVIAVV